MKVIIYTAATAAEAQYVASNTTIIGAKDFTSFTESKSVFPIFGNEETEINEIIEAVKKAAKAYNGGRMRGTIEIKEI